MIDGPIRNLLITAADLLDHNDPHHAITEADRIGMCREVTQGEDPQHGALLDQTPRVERPETRGEYARRLRQIAGVR